MREIILEHFMQKGFDFSEDVYELDLLVKKLLNSPEIKKLIRQRDQAEDMLSRRRFPDTTGQ